MDKNKVVTLAELAEFEKYCLKLTSATIEKPQLINNDMKRLLAELDARVKLCIIRVLTEAQDIPCPEREHLIEALNLGTDING